MCRTSASPGPVWFVGAGRAWADILTSTAVTQEIEGESGAWSRKLYRRLVSSSEVMKLLREDEDFADPEADPERAEDEAVAYNVVQFLVEPKVLDDESGVESDWDRELGEGPDYVDVTLRVVDDRTAVLLPEEADWEGEGALARSLLGDGPDAPEGKRVRTYRTRLPFHD